MKAEDEIPPIVVDPAAPAVQIASRLLSELCAHALEAQPEECCGLLTGNGAQRFTRVHRCQNVMTALHRENPAQFPRDGRQAYYMNEADYLRTQQEAEAAGQGVTAVYHSHVGAGLHFSSMDQLYARQALFPFPEAAQIVLSVWDRVVEAGVFEPTAEGRGFRGRPLEVVEA